MSKKITVGMFGNFNLQYKKVVIDESFRPCNKVWVLLEYLIYNRKRACSQEEIIDLLWPDGKNKNPLNSLKNVLFRLRNILLEAGFADAKEMILHRNGTVSWSNRTKVSCDYEDFESLYYQIISEETQTPEVREYALEAIRIYKSGFLINRSAEQWAANLNLYYSSLYVKIVGRLIDVLEQQRDYNKMLEICSFGVGMLPQDPIINYGMILANIKLGNLQVAIRQYNEARELFRDSVSSRLSAKSSKLYELIISSVAGYERDLSIIRDKLINDRQNMGCLECPLEVFKSIYDLYMREKDRLKEVGFLMLLTLKNKLSGGVENDRYDVQGLHNSPVILNQKQSVDILRESIKASLRAGDVMTRYSVNQYLVIMRNIYDEDDVKKVARRILDKSALRLKSLGYGVSTDYSEI